MPAMLITETKEQKQPPMSVALQGIHSALCSNKTEPFEHTLRSEWSTMVAHRETKALKIRDPCQRDLGSWVKASMSMTNSIAK